MKKFHRYFYEPVNLLFLLGGACAAISQIEIKNFVKKEIIHS